MIATLRDNGQAGGNIVLPNDIAVLFIAYRKRIAIFPDWSKA